MYTDIKIRRNSLVQELLEKCSRLLQTNHCQVTDISQSLSENGTPLGSKELNPFRIASTENDLL